VNIICKSVDAFKNIILFIVSLNFFSIIHKFTNGLIKIKTFRILKRTFNRLLLLVQLTLFNNCTNYNDELNIKCEINIPKN